MCTQRLTLFMNNYKIRNEVKINYVMIRDHF